MKLVLLLVCLICLYDTVILQQVRRPHTNNRAFMKATQSNPQPIVLTPPPNVTIIEILRNYRQDTMRVLKPSTNIPCGIIWAVSSINGSATDYSLLTKIGRGEGRYRLLAVLYEAISSAARAKNALIVDKRLPKHCGVTENDVAANAIELTMFIDRDIVSNLKEHDILDEMKCVFDRIIYFDDLPPVEKSISYSAYKRLHMLVRLAPRPNLMKLIAFLSTPYEYTLYLDGDTDPCPGFQMPIFHSIAQQDVLTTPNPFGFLSTNGKKIYPGSPSKPAFASFPEVNGGVFAYRWNNLTEQLFVRTIELYPYFATLGFDQDQAMMRHALFESKNYFGLKTYGGTMQEYCRHGWKCDLNTCAAGCVIIHQRQCLLDFPHNSSDTNSCPGKMTAAYRRSKYYHGKNFELNSKNRKIGRVKVLDGVV